MILVAAARDDHLGDVQDHRGAPTPRVQGHADAERADLAPRLDRLRPLGGHGGSAGGVGLSERRTQGIADRLIAAGPARTLFTLPRWDCRFWALPNDEKAVEALVI